MTRETSSGPTWNSLGSVNLWVRLSKVQISFFIQSFSMQVKNTDHLLEEIFFGVIESVLIDSSVLFVAVMQTPTPHAITTITVSTSGQDGENTK